MCDFSVSRTPGNLPVTDQGDSAFFLEGTATHMAPERYSPHPYGTGNNHSKMDLARRADVYSYGVLLWEIRVRQSPCQGIDFIV